MSRMEKVDQQLKREIGQIIVQELSDPRVEFVTITKVKASKDLRNARVFFSVLGDPSSIEAAGESLNGARGKIRKSLGQKLKMRFTPELIFSFDDSIVKATRIEETIKEINDESIKTTSNDTEA